MKPIITTLQEALAYQLNGLIYAEKTLRDEFEICSKQLTSRELTVEIQHYIGNADNKIQKLDRIFNYLMQEPRPRKNEVIVRMIADTHHLLDLTPSGHLRDILMIGCVQSINAYKVTVYRTAYRYILELELDTAADFAQQILDWELETSKTLAALSTHEFNRVNNPEEPN